jgi:hypothetical protein
VVNLRPSSRISKASESEPLLTLTLPPSAKRQALRLLSACLPACLHFTTIVVAISTAAAIHTQRKKTAKSSPQIPRTTTTSNTVFIMRHKRVPFHSVPHQKFNLHMRYSKSPSNNAQLKNRQGKYSRDSRKNKQSSTKTARASGDAANSALCI